MIKMCGKINNGANLGHKVSVKKFHAKQPAGCCDLGALAVQFIYIMQILLKCIICALYIGVGNEYVGIRSTLHEFTVGSFCDLSTHNLYIFPHKIKFVFPKTRNDEYVYR